MYNIAQIHNSTGQRGKSEWQNVTFEIGSAHIEFPYEMIYLRTLYEISNHFGG